MRTITMARAIAGLAIICTSCAAQAAPMIAATPIDTPIIVPDSGDTGFIIACALLAMVTAIPGIIAYVAGQVGRAHLPRILATTAMTLAIATLLFVLIGYSLIFDLDGSSWIGGPTHWMLNLMGTVREETTIAETAFVLITLAGLWLGVAIITAALAPRARPAWLIGFIPLWLILVLFPVMRWLAGGGWLAEMGVIDAAGGLFILYCAGVSTMVALVMIGAAPAGERDAKDAAMSLCGALLLLPGMAALTAGATLGAGDDAAVAVLNILITACTAMLALAALRRSMAAATLALGLAGGAVAAMAGGDGLSPGGAVLTGLAAALAIWLTPRLMPRRFAWQDQGLAIATITGSAKVGALLIGLFIAFIPFGGSDFAEGMTMGTQVVAQLVAILAVAGWSLIGTTIAGLTVSLIAPMRDGREDAD